MGMDLIYINTHTSELHGCKYRRNNNAKMLSKVLFNGSERANVYRLVTEYKNVLWGENCGLINNKAGLIKRQCGR